jgi:hypothetical protein
VADWVSRDRREYEQDVRAMVNARTFEGALSVARAMKALGRFDDRANGLLFARSDVDHIRAGQDGFDDRKSGGSR